MTEMRSTGPCRRLGASATAVVIALLLVGVGDALAQGNVDYKAMEPKAAVEYAGALVPEGRRDEAIEIYRYVVDNAGDEVWAPLALYRMANLVANKGNHTFVREAIGLYEQLMTDYPTHWTVTDGGTTAYIARYRAVLREYDQAVVELQERLTQAEPNINSYQWAVAIIELGKSQSRLSRSAEAEEALTGYLSMCPSLLRHHAYFEALVAAQIAEGKPEAALSTARVAYALCEFEDAQIQQAADLVRRAFIANGDMVKGIQFLSAQESAEGANPLRDVAPPEVTQEQKETMLEVAARDVPLQVLILTYSGDDATALARASRYLCEADADKAVDALKVVARAFKGADLNIVRANQFIKYARTGEGENPLAEIPPE